jgi:serine/threonine protein kinase
MGVVYLARQQSLGRLVALKMLPADLAGDAVALARFQREVRALARCDHPNIVKVLTSGTRPDGQLYYTMEYVPGCDLELVWRELSGPDGQGMASSLGSTTWARAILSASRKQRRQAAREATRAGSCDGTAVPPAPRPTAEPSSGEPAEPLPLPPLPELPAAVDDPGGYERRVARLVRDAALALQAVHDQHIIHRDVKPANLMITPDGTRVVLMDFGLAKGQTVTLSASRQGGLLGTLRYAAPEQLAAGTLTVGPPADVRGLGVTLWELLTRRRLFAEAEDEKQLAGLIHDHDVPLLRSVDPTLDPDLEAIGARAVERRVADRIPTARQLAEYLQLYLDGKPLPIRPPTMAEMLKRWMRQHKVRVAVSGLLLLVLVLGSVAGVIGWLWQRAEGAREQASKAQAKAEASFRGEKAAKKKEQRANRKTQRAYQKEREAKEKAEKARKGEQKARWQLVRFKYMRDVDLAHRETGVGNWERARAILRACPEKLRGWEWDYLMRLGPITLRGHTDAVNGVSFSPDGRRLASASWDETVRVWYLATKKVVILRGHTKGVNSVSFSPDGRRLASASDDKTVRVWDLASKEAVILRGHTSGVNSVSFSPDGRRLASASVYQTVRVWDLASKEAVILRGHTGRVNSVSFSPDGRRLASASFDKTVRVWDLASKEAVILRGHTDRVYSVSFSPDGRLASASSDKTVRVYEVTDTSHLWHLREATASEQARQWFAAVFHLRWCIQQERANLALEAVSGATSRLPLGVAAAVVALHQLEGRTDLADLYARRGHALVQLRQWEKAIADLAQATRLKPKNTTYRKHLALAVWKYVNHVLVSLGKIENP